MLWNPSAATMQVTPVPQRFSLNDSFKGDIATDIDVDMDIDSDIPLPQRRLGSGGSLPTTDKLTK